jgi:8-oxo-dGTP pyrophosphatase MutT (NUDIX family)
VGQPPEPSAPQPAPPTPAATVVLARDAQHGGIEIYLVQRQRSMGFMGGMHVFPGGKVAQSDRSPAMRARIADVEHALRHRAWGADIDADAAIERAVAAVRETFEEAGLLLVTDAHVAPLPELRARLLGGDDLAMLLEQAELWLRLGLLEPLSRWITPESEPVRFDTSFYLARAPEGQSAQHDAKESAASSWLSPSQALQASAEGHIRLAPPTARTLEGLLEPSSVEAALAAARSRVPKVIMPVIRTLGSERVILYPGDPEHPVQERALPGPTRQVMRRG